MNYLSIIIFFSFIPAVLLLFAALPPRRAIVIAAVSGWLFMPNLAFDLPGLPAYTKSTSLVYGLMLGVTIFDARGLFSLRPRWFDLPVAIWCLVPLGSSLSNDLGAYDGASAVLIQLMRWGFLYIIGRVYFFDREGLRELAQGIVIGGLIYTPLCLFEIRMSPVLNNWVYGIGSWEGTRLGGYRPRVFFGTGLELGMWMTAASLSGFWLWADGTIRRLWGLPFGWLVMGLFITTVLGKSSGALVLLALGLLVRSVIRRTGWAFPIWCLVAITPCYEATRVSKLWSARNLVEIANSLFGGERAQSLEFRLVNEDMLIGRAMQRPILGWAGWNRARVTDANGRIISVTDGYWIIALGDHGIVGVASLTGSLLLPLVLLKSRYPARLWTTSTVAPAAALAVLLGLYMIDNLFNAMPNPIYSLVLGAVNGFCGRRINPEDGSGRGG